MRVPGHQSKSYVWRWTAALAALAVLALAVGLAVWPAGDGAPTAQAQASDTVDIIDGRVDVDQSGAVNTSDDLADVLLIVNEGTTATLKVVDIRDGRVDVNESGGITTDGADDVDDATLFRVSTGLGVLVDIDDGDIDVNGGGVDTTDDLTGVRLVGDAAVTDKVDIIGGLVDVNESGSITAADDRGAVLLFVNSADSTLFVVSVIDGGVDVNGSGDVTTTDDLANVTLFVSGTPGTGVAVNIVDGQVSADHSDVLLVADFGGTDQVDISASGVDVNESNDITSTDDLADVLLEASDDGARTLILVDVIDGGVDVNGDGNITPADDVNDVTVFVGGIGIQFDIVDGFPNAVVANAMLVASGAVTPGATATPTLTRTPTPTAPTNTPTVTGTPATATPTRTATPVSSAATATAAAAATATAAAGATESVTLVGGTCNPVASTYAENTPIATIAGAVSPSGILISIWWFNASINDWQGYSPQFPSSDISDLTEVDRLEAIFICVSTAGTWSRPLI
jgi:hypothetical protein